MPHPPAPISLAGGLEAAVAQAVAALDAGAVLVVPTETFYGLAVRADDATAVARLCALKGRAPDKALPLIAGDAARVHQHCHVPAPMARLAQAFWPGPLTLALAPRGAWPGPVLAGGNALGVRVSAHLFARRLAQAAGALITATSANLAGEPAVTRLAQLHVNLRRGAVCVDGGTLAGGLPSTVVALAPGGAELQVLRPGAVTAAALIAASGLGCAG